MRRMPGWVAKVGLALGAFLVTFLTLEGGARLLFPVPGPILFRDGIYVNPLPLVNGRPDRTLEGIPRGRTLPMEKKPDELRVVMFGESSVVGSPWGYDGSPATFLWHQLGILYPDRPVTVINMGRASSFTMDAYYYLLSMRRYRPDVVVFYLGFNDRYDADREMCMPASSPTLHTLWRWTVSHSHLAWTLRALGPEWFLRGKDPLAGPTGFGTVRCKAPEAFQGWTELLTGTAHDAGSLVVIATPIRSVFNPLDRKVVRLEEGEDLADVFPGDRAWYADLVGCSLRSDCDAEERARVLTSEGDLPEADAHHCQLDRMEEFHRRTAWIQSAERRGAELVDFAAEFPEARRKDTQDRLYILDEVHLSLDGYWFLAGRIAQGIRRRLEPSHGQEAYVPEFLPDSLLSSIDRLVDGRPGGIHRTALNHGLRYLGTGRLLFAIPVLQILERQGNEDAALVLAWLRANTGNLMPDESMDTSGLKGMTFPDLLRMMGRNPPQGS